jgi:hypothetical protein
MGKSSRKSWSEQFHTQKNGSHTHDPLDRFAGCISRRTYDEARGRFDYREACPRLIRPEGLEDLGEQQV